MVCICYYYCYLLGRKIFKQTWKNNMEVAGEPTITPSTKEKEFTRITFSPDLEKFNMTHLDNDTVRCVMYLVVVIFSLFTRRVYDIAGSYPALKVSMNEKRLSIKSFEDYVKLYYPEDSMYRMF